MLTGSLAGTALIPATLGDGRALLDENETSEGALESARDEEPPGHLQHLASEPTSSTLDFNDTSAKGFGTDFGAPQVQGISRGVRLVSFGNSGSKGGVELADSQLLHATGVTKEDLTAPEISAAGATPL